MSTTNQQSINISVNQAIVAFVLSMAIACAFVAYITNTIVNGKVSALTTQLAAQSTAVPQTNTAGDVGDVACVGSPYEEGEVTSAPPASGSTTAVMPFGRASLSVAGLKSVKLLPPANVSYNQSNAQTTISTSTNNYTDSRYSGNTISVAWNNGNTTDSGNSTTTNTTNNNNQAWNNGNTVNSGNSSTTNTSTTTNTTTNNNQAWNNGNTVAWNNGNTTNSGNSTTTNTDASNNSVNTVVSGNPITVLIP